MFLQDQVGLRIRSYRAAHSLLVRHDSRATIPAAPLLR
jgi:hypothetical protein